MKRARRRADKDRMKRKAERVYPWYTEAARLADHIKNCSCAACCNLRKIEGPTKQEKLRDDVQDYMQD